MANMKLALYSEVLRHKGQHFVSYAQSGSSRVGIRRSLRHKGQHFVSYAQSGSSRRHAWRPLCRKALTTCVLGTMTP